MTGVLRLQPLARARVAALGEVGRTWHAELPAVLAGLSERWMLTLGRALPGGSASYVVEARTDLGEEVVLKVAMADAGFPAEVEALRRGEGAGYARLLDHDPVHQAVLMERLGPSLSGSGLGVEEQLDALVATLSTAWRPPDRTPSDRARSLADGIRARQAHAGPAGRPVVERALAYASELGRTDPGELVLVHGDPHPGNLLRVRAPRPGAESGWCFVDPEPCVTDRAYDLGVAVRDFSSTLLADPAAASARLWSWCRRVAEPVGIDPARVWAWGFLERVSTGLYVHSFGAPRVGEPFLRSAALVAGSGTPGRTGIC
ncbi:MAG: aminoglycoside phosphotransferase family protein [Janthinobacterium lividum]